MRALPVPYTATEAEALLKQQQIIQAENVRLLSNNTKPRDLRV
ncbi:MAG: hypothetical protein U1G07_17195 [Verrucomicrobiota bacterium]